MNIKKIQISENEIYDIGVEIQNVEGFQDVVEALEATITSKADKSDIVQSDWDQNDETAKDYIKNRPFGMIEGAVEIFPETVMEQRIMEILFVPVKIELGKSYIVTFDGISYECTARAYDDGAILIGNGALENNGWDGLGNGEPFLCQGYGDEYLEIYPSFLEGTFTISISSIEEIAQPIDIKYLPASIPIVKGGTGADSPVSARINLGFEYGETAPTHAPSTGDGSVYFMIQENITPTAIAEGGTGAVTAIDARINLGAMASDNPTGTGILSIKGTGTTAPQIQLFEDGAAAYNVRMRSSDDYIYFDGAQAYFFDNNLRSGKNIYSGGKVTLIDGKNGCFLGAGHIYIQESNPSIRFMLGSQTDADNPNAKITLLSGGTMNFENTLGGYKFDGNITTTNGSFIADGSLLVGGKTTYNDGKTGMHLAASGGIHLQHSSGPSLRFYVGTATADNGRIYMNSDDYMHFKSAARYVFDKAIYINSSAVSTSDKNKKKDFKEFDERYENLFFDLKPQIYKFKDGTSDRFHTGFISQEVEESMFKNGLKSTDFAGYCKEIQRKIVVDTEEEYKEEEVFDENGNPVYDYMLRYEEFIALNTHMLQKAYNQIDEMKDTIKSLQDEIIDLKNQVNG